ncbi:hypothetical protein ESP51_04905 [Agromyces albus]|uniref:Uncharacterized protein n=1 Tax=Agromyces albus TaxID=205332 RepID=A0A4Q2L2A0_9MICO|nr:hypothetical protein ESP51_04905 [Agromyces albus]
MPKPRLRRPARVASEGPPERRGGAPRRQARALASTPRRPPARRQVERRQRTALGARGSRTAGV